MKLSSKTVVVGPAAVLGGRLGRLAPECELARLGELAFVRQLPGIAELHGLAPLTLGSGR